MALLCRYSDKFAGTGLSRTLDLRDLLLKVGTFIALVVWPLAKRSPCETKKGSVDHECDQCVLLCSGSSLDRVHVRTCGSQRRSQTV